MRSGREVVEVEKSTGIFMDNFLCGQPGAD